MPSAFEWVAFGSALGLLLVTVVYGALVCLFGRPHVCKECRRWHSFSFCPAYERRRAHAQRQRMRESASRDVEK